MRICKTLGEDSQGFMSLWESISKYSQDFGRVFVRICKTLGEDLQDSHDFGRICARI